MVIQKIRIMKDTKHILMLISVLILCMSAEVCSAQKYFTKNGDVSFKGSVDTFEPVEAQSKNTTAILDVESGAFATLLFIRSFHFDVALMEEHFNENYMESNKFPKASFKGSIDPSILDSLSEVKSEATAKGVMTIHGVSKEVEIQILISLTGDHIEVSTRFSLSPSDFNIEIPKIVRSKISETIEIETHYVLEEKN